MFASNGDNGLRCVYWRRLCRSVDALMSIDGSVRQCTSFYVRQPHARSLFARSVAYCIVRSILYKKNLDTSWIASIRSGSSSNVVIANMHTHRRGNVQLRRWSASADIKQITVSILWSVYIYTDHRILTVICCIRDSRVLWKARNRLQTIQCCGFHYWYIFYVSRLWRGISMITRTAAHHVGTRHRHLFSFSIFLFTSRIALQRANYWWQR